MPVIKRKIKPDSFVYMDSYRSYNALDVNDVELAILEWVGWFNKKGCIVRWLCVTL